RSSAASTAFLRSVTPPGLVANSRALSQSSRARCVSRANFLSTCCRRTSWYAASNSTSGIFHKASSERLMGSPPNSWDPRLATTRLAAQEGRSRDPSPGFEEWISRLCQDRDAASRYHRADSWRQRDGPPAAKILAD